MVGDQVHSEYLALRFLTFRTQLYGHHNPCDPVMEQKLRVHQASWRHCPFSFSAAHWWRMNKSFKSIVLRPKKHKFPLILLLTVSIFQYDTSSVDVSFGYLLFKRLLARRHYEMSSRDLSAAGRLGDKLGAVGWRQRRVSILSVSLQYNKGHSADNLNPVYPKYFEYQALTVVERWLRNVCSFLLFQWAPLVCFMVERKHRNVLTNLSNHYGGHHSSFHLYAHRVPNIHSFD